MFTWLHRHGVALRPFFRLGSERDYACSISLGAGGEPDNCKAMGVDRDPRGRPGSSGYTGILGVYLDHGVPLPKTKGCGAVRVNGLRSMHEINMYIVWVYLT